MKFYRMCMHIISFAVCLFTVSCYGAGLEKRQFLIRTSDGTPVSITAEIARTEQEQEHGFMERKHIPDGTGMLFVFDRDRILDFWMKNTPTALSIAYIDSTGRIRDIFDMTPFSLASITSTVYVRYALEVPQGWFSRVGIKQGDIVPVDEL